jgi:hypothetical protein
MENKDGFLVIRRETFMRVTGTLIKGMVKAQELTLMVASIQVIIKMKNNMVKEYILGLMAVSM